MIEKIKEYLSLQKKIVAELLRRSVDLWSCHEDDILGWECNSHGEHVCCVNPETGAQIEIPLLTKDNAGIDAGHFAYYLTSIGESPKYMEMHNTLSKLEGEGVLIQVQKGSVPVVWDLKPNKITTAYTGRSAGETKR